TAADEYFASSGFGFTVIDGSTEITESSESGVIYTDRRARWTRQQLERPTTLYYKLQAYRSVERLALPDIAPPAVRPPLLEEDQLAALERLVAKLAAVSSGPESFTGLLIQEINNQSPDQDSLFLLSSYSEDPVILMLDVLAYQGISASRVRGIMLEDGRRRQTLSSLIEIHTADGSIVFNPRSAATGLPDNFFIWQRGDNAILNVIGGRNSSLEFAMVSNRLPVKTLIGMGQGSTEIDLLDFSIYALPVEQQGIFKGLLLIPVAALIVVLMRILVGVRTSGTFMPVLIALAFIQTTLMVGLMIFIGLLSIGLWIRSYLSHLNLLLVSRVAAVIIVVILLMAVLAIVSYKLGLDQALTVTFFPTVIVAW
ncbi:MAG: UUP1 family membrane protein, partial [Porticoccaceae bacterium]